jgi:hypothetical protein
MAFDELGVIKPYPPMDKVRRNELMELLRAAPEQEETPGKCYREVVYQGEVYRASITKCWMCRRTWPLMFMVHDDLWRERVPENGHLCLECFETQRLGRLLQAADLKPNVPGNYDVIYLLTTRG